MLYLSDLYCSVLIVLYCTMLNCSYRILYFVLFLIFIDLHFNYERDLEKENFILLLYGIKVLIYLPDTYLYIYLSIYPSAYLYIHLPIYLPIYLSNYLYAPGSHEPGCFAAQRILLWCQHCCW